MGGKVEEPAPHRIVRIWNLGVAEKQCVSLANIPCEK
jgi:hypothetical protein